MQPAQAKHMNERVKTFLFDVEKKRDSLKKKTRAKARALFNAYYKKRHLKDNPFAEVEDPFPVSPEIIIRQILRVNYVESDSIPIQDFEEFTSGKSMTEIAGLIDRRTHRIVIATKFDPEWRRFTAAHEIGHWLLHQDVIYLRERPVWKASNSGSGKGLRPDLIRLRERPITGHELAYTKRPPVEREADLFAAELLMPPDHLVEKFFYRFGGPINGAEASEALAFWLSLGSKRDFDASEFSSWPRRQRSRLVAQTTSFNGSIFTSLTKRFGVSTTPMAIQLEDLGLVT